MTRHIPSDIKDRLIVALDLPTVEEARAVIDRLGDEVSIYKIGYWLMFAEGFWPLFNRLVEDGKGVFLDYKMYDIGETVRRGVASVAARGAKFLTVHGDAEIMKAAVDGRGDSDLKILAVSVLTSLDDAALKAMGYQLDAKSLIELRVKQAAQTGCDGVIASASDDPNALRALAGRNDLLVVTPGIRPAGAGVQDHKRPATPRDAIANGSDYLVVGRPIVQAQDPAAAAHAIIEEMRLGLG